MSGLDETHNAIILGIADELGLVRNSPNAGATTGFWIIGRHSVIVKIVDGVLVVGAGDSDDTVVGEYDLSLPNLIDILRDEIPSWVDFINNLESIGGFEDDPDD